MVMAVCRMGGNNPRHQCRGPKAEITTNSVSNRFSSLYIYIYICIYDTTPGYMRDMGPKRRSSGLTVAVLRGLHLHAGGCFSEALLED